MGLSLKTLSPRSFSDGDYDSDLQITRNAIRHFDAGGAVNFLFVLYGPMHFVHTPRHSNPEDPEEESAESDDEVDMF